MHNNNNGYPSNLAAWTTVAILMVAYVLSFIDRQILNLLVGPIRRDLAISDTEMSLLMGLSFALFYTLCGIPLGRMADNRSRRGLILFGVLVWSAMTAACGLARSYWQFLTFRGYGSGAWVPTFFVRTHGWDAGHVGVVYGSIVAVFGCLGIVFGGRLADYWAKRGRSDANMRVGLLAAWAVIPFTLVYPLLDNANWAAALMAPTVFFLSMPFGVAPAAIQEIMPNSMRGQASAIYLFVVTLFGLGVGPTAVALVTDFVFADDMALRYSLLLVTLAAVLGAVVLLGIGLKPYRASLEHLKDWSLRREGEGGEDWKASRQPA